MLILADTREKQLLKRLALISFRSDIIDFNEMFIEWSAGVAKSFASLPDGYLWGFAPGRGREAHTNLCCQNSSSKPRFIFTHSCTLLEYIWLLILIRSIFNLWNTFLTLTRYWLKSFNWNVFLSISAFLINLQNTNNHELSTGQASISYVGEQYEFFYYTINPTSHVHRISGLIDWQGVTLLLWVSCRPVWFIVERMDGSVNITEL